MNSIDLPIQTKSHWTISISGVSRDPLPNLPNVSFTSKLTPETDAVLALPGTAIKSLYRELWARQQLLLPIINATGAELPRADASLTGFSANQLVIVLEELTPMVARLARLPAPPAENREAYTALALAYSRRQTIEAHWAPGRASVVAYPLLTGVPFSSTRLNQLAMEGLLDQRFFDRVHECAACQSARVLAREECETCHSSHLEQVQTVHHYSCGYQGLRPDFMQDGKLVCPKCRERLRHYGVDYDISGEVSHCHACGHQSADVEVGFVCMDCGHHTAAQDAQTHDLYHYVLTGDGQSAVLAGALPDLLGQHGEPARITSFEEFDRLMGLEQRRSRRSKRPHVVMRLGLRPGASLSQRLGANGLAGLYRQVADVVAERLRESDIIAWRGPQIYLLMPETPVENAGIVAGKLAAVLPGLFDVGLDFSRLDIALSADISADTGWLDLPVDT